MGFNTLSFRQIKYKQIIKEKTAGCTFSLKVVTAKPFARPFVQLICPQWYTIDGMTLHDRSQFTTCLQPLAIWNRRFRILNMIIDLIATKFACTITHDI